MTLSAWEYNDTTTIHITEEQKHCAIMSAIRMTMSDHEWTWTQEEQQNMAGMILWLCTENSKLKGKLKQQDTI